MPNALGKRQLHPLAATTVRRMVNEGEWGTGIALGHGSPAEGKEVGPDK
jgi:hypothetical protein